ncbi:PHP domain-containing protein [Klugiella xanthotipulae]|nr:PHP domain-containing protein [Klugiella xanthotipulae]
MAPQTLLDDGRYDLHTHSVVSDGTLTPAEIVDEAADLGLAGIALTDHDTTGGWLQAAQRAADRGLSFVPGMELTTKTNGLAVHLLGYYIDPTYPPLREVTDRIRGDRDRRARAMVQLLSDDIAFTWDDVLNVMADGATVGRPHIADALVSRGFYADRGAAFADVLHPGSKYYVPNYAVETVDGVRLIREAGGVPILAHPAAQRQRRAIPVSALVSLAEAGLYGIELDHPENRAEWLPPLRVAATELRLAVTGASDYHGAGKANRLGQCTTDAEVVRALAAEAHL